MEQVILYRCLNCFHPWSARSKQAQSRRCSKCGARCAVTEEAWKQAIDIMHSTKSQSESPPRLEVALTDAFKVLAKALRNPSIPPNAIQKLLEEAE